MTPTPGQCIDACGRPVARIGECFEVAYRYTYRAPTIAAGASLLDEFQVMDDDADFVWLYTKVTGATFLQTLRLRDGRGYYLSNAGVPGIGQGAALVTPLSGGSLVPEVLVLAGSRIGIELRNNSLSSMAPVITFSGLKRYYKKEGSSMGSAAFWPAPFMLGGLGAEVPPGFEDHFYQYVSAPVNIPAATVLQAQVIQMDADSDFLWRGLSFGNSANGSSDFCAVRFQDSDGYFRSNARIMLPALGGPLDTPGPVFPEIVVPARGLVTFEVENTLPATAVTGFQMVLHGVKRFRRRAAA